MFNAPEVLHEDDDRLTPRTLDSGERTPLVEWIGGYRCTSLDVIDLDPPTPILPHAVD